MTTHEQEVKELRDREAEWERLANAHRGGPRTAHQQRFYDIVGIGIAITAGLTTALGMIAVFDWMLHTIKFLG